MKNKNIFLMLSIVQILLGAVLIVSFAVVAIGGIDVRPYVTTAVVAVFFVVMGIVTLVRWVRQNKGE